MLHAGPGLDTVEEFESFIEYANRVEMVDAEFDKLRRLVARHIPSKPLYVWTVKKSHVVEGKAKMVNIPLNNK